MQESSHILLDRLQRALQLLLRLRPESALLEAQLEVLHLHGEHLHCLSNWTGERKESSLPSNNRNVRTVGLMQLLQPLNLTQYCQANQPKISICLKTRWQSASYVILNSLLLTQSSSGSNLSTKVAFKHKQVGGQQLDSDRITETNMDRHLQHSFNPRHYQSQECDAVLEKCQWHQVQSVEIWTCDYFAEDCMDAALGSRGIGLHWHSFQDRSFCTAHWVWWPKTILDLEKVILTLQIVD